MNKILREEMEYLIQCDDKAITPDVKDDVSLTLQYIDELENKIDKAIEYLTSTTHFVLEYDKPFRKLSKYEEQYEKREEDLLNILKGEDE